MRTSRLPARICEHCGESYAPRTFTNKFCSRCRPTDTQARRRWYRERDPERTRATKQAWDLRYKERLRAQERAYRQRYPEKVAARHRLYHQRNAERIAARKRLYAQLHPRPRRKEDPEMSAARRDRRRARKMGAPGSHTLLEWKAVLARFGNRCAICGMRGKMTKDHIQPLSRGGSDNAENLQPLCLRCNSAKGTKLAWEKKGGQLAFA